MSTDTGIQHTPTRQTLPQAPLPPTKVIPQAPLLPTKVIPQAPLLPPRVATSIILACAVVASLAPSLLPRSSPTQAVVTGVFAACALALSAGTHRITRKLVALSPRPLLRGVAATAGSLTVAAAGTVNAHWQNSLRAAMETDSTTPLHWIEVLCGSISVCAVLVVVGVGAFRACRALGWIKVFAALLVSAAAGVVIVAPMTTASFVERHRIADAAVDSSHDIPSSSSRSGSANSLVSWDALGREGRKFVSGGTDGSAVRTYVGLAAAQTVAERARLAVADVAHAGGFDKSHVVVAVPTGSGWIDDNAVSGIEERFAGDVATVAAQYSNQPSWATFLFAEDSAKESATAVLDAIGTRVAAMDEAARPKVYVYGQSLGSIGGSSAVAQLPAGVCGALWAGPPAGEVATGGAVILANSSDPVVWWSSDLLLSSPDLRSTRRDAPVPQWMPVISYLQTTVDMVSALDAPAGHGHRYGRDQGLSLPDCS
ncbi:MAG: alpha/beta-hydrolase family protein [Rhodococcus sp. (in: high G+C Gram-positive bacteria)]